MVVLVSDYFCPLLEDYYAEDFIWINGLEVLNRPHLLGEIYWDLNHVNAKGYEACADLIFSKMRTPQLLHTIEELQVIDNRKAIPYIDLELPDKQAQELREYIEKIKGLYEVLPDKKIGSIVMNCNPFTLGHRYLIREARKQCDILYVFVVEEDKSYFSFEDRIRLVKEGVKDFGDVVVVPSGNFIISQRTFDAYFVKDKKENVSYNPAEDVIVFAAKIAPALGIGVRFAGEEPFDRVTDHYNSAMMRLLPKFGVEFKVIERKKQNGIPISASLVRRLLKEKKMDKIKELVPYSTYEYLRNEFSDSKSVLVLGGTKFMGIRLVEKLIEKKYFVTVANRGTQKDKFGNKVERILYDRLDEQTVKNTLKGKQYDIVFDTSAYSSMAVKNVLDYVICPRYVQVSSVAVYDNHRLDLGEEQFDAAKADYVLSQEDDYGKGKRGAECAALQGYPEKSIAIVRVPFVVEPDYSENREMNMRLFFYVKHIAKELPFYVDNFDYCCSFVRTTEEADFLIHIAESEYDGVSNFASEGCINVAEIIDYVEKKTGKKAIITSKGNSHPLYGTHFGYTGCSLNLDVAKRIGYIPSDLKTWIYKLLDKYIDELQ